MFSYETVHLVIRSQETHLRDMPLVVNSNVSLLTLIVGKL